MLLLASRVSGKGTSSVEYSSHERACVLQRLRYASGNRVPSPRPLVGVIITATGITVVCDAGLTI